MAKILSYGRAMDTLRPFHLAMPVTNLKKAIAFYDSLGFASGRKTDTWVDYNFFGHQLVFHTTDKPLEKFANPVDNKEVPVPHFGVVLEWQHFDRVAEKLKIAGVEFIIEPYLRFAGQVGEQKTMFFKDPNGLYIEFKAVPDDSKLFEKYK